MISIASIYQSKLGEITGTWNDGIAKSSAAAARFTALLSAIESATESATGTPADAVSSETAGASGLAISQSSAEIETAIENASQETGVDADLLRAVIQVESSFRADAVSGAGAQGLMQLMPGTAKEMGVTDPFDADQNVQGGAGYLEKLLRRFGDIRLALAAYNTGQGRIASLGITDPDDPEQYAKISSGVRGYVDKVLGYYQQFGSE